MLLASQVDPSLSQVSSRFHLPVASSSGVTTSMFQKKHELGGGFKYFFFSPLFGEMIQFDCLTNIFQMG